MAVSTVMSGLITVRTKHAPVAWSDSLGFHVVRQKTNLNNFEILWLISVIHLIFIAKAFVT